MALDRGFTSATSDGGRMVGVHFSDHSLIHVRGAVETHVVDALTETFLESESESILRNIDRAELKERIFAMIADRIAERIFQACQNSAASR